MSRLSGTVVLLWRSIQWNQDRTTTEPQQEFMKINDKHIKEIEKLIPTKDQQKFVDQVIGDALEQYKIAHSDAIEVFCDGGSRGNPGIAGGGFGVYQGGQLVHKGCQYFGEMTNNQAEYLSLRLALREVYEKFGGDIKLQCYMDSEFVVKQMNGEYKVKNANIKPLYEEVRRIADQFKHFKINHIRREQNKLADSLANEAMDKC